MSLNYKVFNHEWVTKLSLYILEHPKNSWAMILWHTYLSNKSLNINIEKNCGIRAAFLFLYSSHSYASKFRMCMLKGIWQLTGIPFSVGPNEVSEALRPLLVSTAHQMLLNKEIVKSYTYTIIYYFIFYNKSWLLSSFWDNCLQSLIIYYLSFRKFKILIQLELCYNKKISYNLWILINSTDKVICRQIKYWIFKLYLYQKLIIIFTWW